MQELLLVNPRKRKASKSRKAASPKQLAARRKFAAMSRARSKKSRATRTTAKGPTMAKRRKSTRRAVAVRANPAKRRSVRRSRKSYRRNPINLGATMARPMAMLKPAFVGALGAVAVNTILDKLPLPVMMTTGRMVYLTRALGAVALGVVASKLGVKGATAAKMAEGSLTVTLYSAIIDVAGQAGVTLSGYQGAGQRVGQYLTGPGSRQQNMSAYLTGSGAPQRMARAPTSNRSFGR